MLSRTSVAEEASRRPLESKHSWKKQASVSTGCQILLASWDEIRLVILADSLGPSLASLLHFMRWTPGTPPTLNINN